MTTKTEALDAILGAAAVVTIADPARAVGLARALASPLPAIGFFPTGGISREDAAAYLAVDDVVCVGGSWVASAAAVAAGDRPAISALAEEAAALGRRGSMAHPA